MFSTMSRIAFASIIFFMFCQEASCAEGLKSKPDDALIDGVTNFLADRAQANAAYIFTSKLSDNRALQCYLPNTYETIQNTNLILLLKTSSHIWRDRIEEDIKFATILSLLIKDTGYDVTKKLKADELAILFANFLKKTNQQERIENIKYDIDKITAQIEEVKSRLNKIASLSKGTHELPTCLFGGRDINAAVNNLEQYEAILKSLKNNLTAGTEPANPSTGTTEVFNALTSLYTSISNISDSKTKKSKNTSYSTAAVDLINLMEVICDTKNSRNAICDATRFQDNNSNEYESGNDKLNKVKTYLLFFASLADAETSDQVTVVLQNFMLPPVSFGEIREKNHWAIAAYVGGAIARTNNGDYSRPGLFAPVGIQGSFACSDRKVTLFDNKSWCPHGGSMALMLSPFDFAYPLNLKFKGANNTATWNDVINPSISVVYGFANEPINLGIAWQRVNQGLNNPNSSTRILVFIALDMPLYIIH